jgi:hypothetical protein
MTKHVGPSKPAPRVYHGIKERAPHLLLAAGLASIIVWYIDAQYGIYFAHANMPIIMNEQYQVLFPVLFLVPYVLLVVNYTSNYQKPFSAEKQGAVDAVWLPISRVWNMFLTLLSFVMFFGLLRGLIPHSLQVTSFHEFVCDPALSRWEGPRQMYMWLFTMSKYAELFDTLILIKRGKVVPFLHWYHHVTVLAYTWIGVINMFTPGWAFGTVNCVVHCIMYDYYRASSEGKRVTYAKSITTLQIVQMIAGIGFTGTWYAMHLQNPATCPAGRTELMLACAGVIYASYFALFLSFYIKRYLKKKQKQKTV